MHDSAGDSCSSVVWQLPQLVGAAVNGPGQQGERLMNERSPLACLATADERCVVSVVRRVEIRSMMQLCRLDCDAFNS